MLFVAAKVSHLGLLPQGQPERSSRAIKMVRTMDSLGFGNCTNHYECKAVCPVEISATFISRLNRDYGAASITDALTVGKKRAFATRIGKKPYTRTQSCNEEE